MTDPREPLGRLVRQVWVNCAKEQPNPKPSWLVPWDELDPDDPADAFQREVDMRIGEAIAVEARALQREADIRLAEEHDAISRADCTAGCTVEHPFTDVLRSQP